MKPQAIKLLSIFLLSAVLFSCSKEDDGIYFNETIETVNTDNVSYSEIETEILKLVNEYRQSIDLNPLTTLKIISGVADEHTNYMIETGEVSHDNFNKRAELLKTNIGATSVGENVAYGYNSAQGVLNGWLNSPNHKKIIESANYTHFGISTDSNNDGQNYFTQIFIKK